MALGHTLKKAERIYLREEIRTLFASRTALSAYPFRVLIQEKERNEAEPPLKTLISVPKKKLKRAVWRNQVKRRTREAYRQAKLNLVETIEQQRKSTTLLLAFVYVEEEVLPYPKIRKGMEKALQLIQKKYNDEGA